MWGGIACAGLGRLCGRRAGRVGAEQGAWVVRTGCCGYLHWVELRGAGLSGGGCLRGGVDPEIGSDEFFDHTGELLGAGLAAVLSL